MTLNLDDAMKDLLAGDEASFQRRLKDVDPMILRGLYERSRELGRSLFIAAEYSEAIEKFTGALCIAPSSSDKASLFANRAACYLKLNRLQDALNEARKAIAMDQTFAKGWYRAAQALEATRNFAGAKSAYAQAARCAGVDLESDTSNEIYRRWRAVDEELTKALQKRRYDIDYGRFEALVKELTSQEQIERQAQEETGTSIEFAEGLTDEQKATLKAQLTGKVDVESYGLPFDGSGLMIKMDKASRLRECEKSQRESLLSVFQLQYESRYPDRLFNLLDSGLLSKITQSLIAMLKVAPSIAQAGGESYVFIGFGSLLPLLGSLRFLLSSRLEMPAIHVISRGMSISAYETLARLCHQNKLKVQQHVHFHRDVDCFSYSASKTAYEERENENKEANNASTPGDEERALQTKGKELLDEASSKNQLPREPSLCIVDLESLDGYLMGPRFPMLRKFYQKWSKCLFFPTTIILKARLLQLPDQDHVNTSSLTRYLRWSLFPVPVSHDLLKVCRLSAATEINSFPLSEIGYDQAQYAYFEDDEVDESDAGFNWTDKCLADGVILYLCLVDQSGDLLFDAFRDQGPPSLRPHLFWLNPTGPETTTSSIVRFPVENGMIIGAELGQNEPSDSVIKGIEFKIYASSFTEYVTASCDRHQWESWVMAPSSQGCLGPFLSSTIDKLKSSPTLPPQSRLSLMEATSTHLAEDVNVVYFEVGNIHHTLDTVCALLRRRVGMDVLFPKEREVALTIMDASQGSIRLLRSLLSSRQCLKKIREQCWIEPPKMSDDWHPADGSQKQAQSSLDDNEDLTNVRDWLFTYETKNGRPRFRLKAGAVHGVRCLPEYESPEARIALCKLYGVPPDTPGLEQRKGCVELPPIDLAIMGNPSTLPLDCFSSNLFAQIIYIKEVILRRAGQIIPAGVRLYMTLLRHTLSLETLDLTPLSCLRCPVGPQQCSETLYSVRSIVSADALSNFVILSEKTEFLNIDFGGSPDAILASLAGQRQINVRALSDAGGDCNGIYINTEYWGIGPAGELLDGLLQNVMPFNLTSDNIIVYSLASLNSFKLTPLDQTRHVMSQEEEMNQSSPGAAMLSMKESELVHNLGQSLASSKEVVEQVANACVACSSLPCEEAMRDGRVVNNLLFAALS